MKKYLIIISILLGSIVSCGTSEVVIPEGTPTDVAQMMTKYHLRKPKAEKLVGAFKNQSGLSQFKLEDISSVYEKTVGAQRVLVVSVGTRSSVIVNLD